MSRGGGVDAVAAAEVVVVGTGVAGLTAALGCAPRRVTLLTKTRLGAGGASPWAQGGVAAAVGEDDSPALHAADTLAAGAGLSVPEIVDLLVREGPERVRALLALGARFDRDADGDLSLGREAAHSRRRILHARDATGAEMVRALVEAVRRAPHVRVLEETFALDLVVEGGRVVGLLALDPDGRRVLHQASAVVLATGGLGRLYLHTTNPPEATGDGLAMAARAGARLVDLEFVQFHPTALAAGSDPLPLLTEALRGEGAVLVDGRGRRFMPDEHSQAELAPRDVVARAIWKRQVAGEPVFLDARAALGDRFPERFPTVFALCREHGLDPRREPIPVTPAAHYHMGGVAVDERGRGSLAGLWACGEVAATGVHGANRLASNSLLEALVFGARVAEDLRAQRPAPRPAAVAAAERLRVAAAQSGDPELVAAIRRLMWEKVGLVREARGLEEARGELARLRVAYPGPAGEAGNLLDLARLLAEAALVRRESRGGHFRADFPAPDPAWERRLFLTATPDGAPRFEPAIPAAAAAAGAR
ncbi:MAG TPA: L-aspartate oxidase [Thermoanaerobaculia bacterium]|nr:L-aspartate oxidase [Thermoanaerobaculia bacterium]